MPRLMRYCLNLLAVLLCCSLAYSFPPPGTDMEEERQESFHRHDSVYRIFRAVEEDEISLKPQEKNLRLYELAMELAWINQEVYRGDTTELYAYQALYYADLLKDNEKIYRAQDAMAYSHYEQSQYPEAIAGFSNLLKNPYVQKQDSLRADVLDWLSLCYLYSDAHAEAIDKQLQALGIRKVLGDTFGLLNSYFSMGEISEKQEHFEDAIKHYTEALNFALGMDSFQKFFFAPALYVSIGNSYLQIDQSDSAFTNIHRGYRMSEETEDEYLRLLAMESMGEYYIHQELPYSAREYYEQMSEMVMVVDAGDFLAGYWKGMGQVCQLEDNHPSALAYFRKLERKVKDEKLTGWLEETYQLMSQSFASMAKMDSAYHYAMKLADVKDIIHSKKSEAQVSSLDAGIALLKKENENTEELLEKDRTIRNLIATGGIILFIFLLAVALMIGFNYKKSLRINKMLANNNKMIKFQNEKLTLYNEDLRQFAYATSHQFKQPLRTIGGFSSLLRLKLKDRINAEESEYFDFITGAVEDMSTLLAKLLSYTALENKRVRYTEENLGEIVGRIEANLPEHLRERNPKVKIHTMPEMLVNRDHMLVLLNSLIENAIKFNKSDEPTVTVYYEVVDGIEQIIISDNGIGVEEPYRQKVFNLFQRLNDKTEYDGSGMGLPIAKRIVKHYRGEIWMESAAGQGSRVIFTLPDAQMSPQAKTA